MRLSRALALAVVLVASAVPVAPAWQRTLGFEIAPGPLNAQYAAQGALFDSSLQSGEAPPVHVATAAAAHSGTRVAGDDACAVGGAQPRIAIWLPGRPTHVELEIRGRRKSGRTVSDPNAYFQWDAPDFGVPQGEASVALSPNGSTDQQNVWHHVSIDAGATLYIEQLNILGLSPDMCIEIDDLVYGTPGEDEPRGPVVDVGDTLRWTGSLVPQGREVTYGARVIRLGGTSGRVDVALKANPAVGFWPDGVTGEATPAQITGSAAVTPITVRVRAAGNAALGGASLMLEAAPVDASAGDSLLYTSTDIFSHTTQVNANYDLRVRSIEVNQGTQYLDDRGVPVPFVDDPSRPVPYAGVRLAGGLTTAVRVYVSATGVPEAYALTRFGMRLRGFRGSVELPGSPLNPRGLQPKAWNLPLQVGRDDRADPLRSFTFRLPYSWTNGEISLRAELVPPWFSPTSVLPPACATLFCQQDDRFTLSGIRFANLKERIIAPVAVTASGEGPLPDPTTIFEKGLRILPGAFESLVWYTKYIATIDVTKIRDSTDPKIDKNTAYGKAVVDWTTKNWDRGTSDFVVGVNQVERGVNFTDISALPTWPSISLINPVRPLTSTAHEVGHGLGLPHADSACGGGGFWPPDGRGHTYGVGLDLDAPRADGHYTPMVDTTETSTDKPWIDFMSYCADIDERSGARNGNVWISPANWDRIIGNWNSPAPQKRAATPAERRATPRLTVVGVVEDGRFQGVSAFPETRTPLDLGSSGEDDVFLTARNAAGQVVAGAMMRTYHGHVHPMPGDTGPPVEVHLVIGDMPATRVASLGFEQSGRALGTLRRAAAAPAVRILAPRAGTTLPARGSATVRFTSGRGAIVLATVEVSDDGGRSWRAVWSGQTTTARIPVAAFHATRSGLLRVRVVRGLREGSATVGRLVAAGTPPRVAIVAPGPRLVTTTPVDLVARAEDERGTPIVGAAVTWTLDGVRVARGAHAVIPPLAPGTWTLRVTARDRRGRTATAAQRVSVRLVLPSWLLLRQPASVPRTARAVTLQVASRYVGPTIRRGRAVTRLSTRLSRLVVPIPAGSADAIVRLVANGQGADTPIVLRIRRR